MKKVYLFGALLIAGSSAFGQANYNEYNFGTYHAKVNPNPITDVHHEEINSDDRVSVIWTENFTTGAGLVTANGVWTVEGANGSYWSIDGGGVAPNGYALSMNGNHLLWDSYNGVQNDGLEDPQVAFAVTPVSGSIITPAMDLSSTAAMTLEFDLNTMFCCNIDDLPWEYSISTDNGVTWGAPIELDFGLGNNDNSNDVSSPMHYTKVLPLDAVIANNNDVKIKFTWDASVANGNGQYSTHYYWTIDNISISDVPDYDMHHENFWLADVQGGAQLEYTEFPANQVTTLTCQSTISNFGSSTPTNLNMEVTIFDDSNNIIGSTVTGGTLLGNTIASGESDTLTFATGIDLTTFALGEYNVRSVILYTEADEVQGNDTLWRSFIVTENQFGHINLDLPGTANQFYTDGESQIGSIFDIITEDVLYGVDFYLITDGGTVNESTIDQFVTLFIYDDEGNYLESYDYTLTEDMLDTWYTFNLNQSETNGVSEYTLDANTTYLITLNSSFGEVLWYNSSAVDADFSGLEIITGTAFDDTYWAGAEPWMKLNFDQVLSVEEEASLENISVSQNVPNPFNGNTVISYNLNETANVSIKVVDVTGKVVSSINKGNQTTGEHNITIDGSKLAQGTYFYTLTAGEYSVTKRMVVSK
jgi:hypothetical protein